MPFKRRDLNEPSAPQKAALAGTSGTPSATNKYVTNSDPRLSVDSDVGAQTEIDFGSLNYIRDKKFTITNSSVLSTSTVITQLARSAPTGRVEDETEMDNFVFACKPANGSFELWARSLYGPVSGKYKVNYIIIN